MNPIKIKLSRPLDINGASVTELTMREPKVKDMRLARTGTRDEADQEVRLFANLCEITPDNIDDLPVRDYGQLQEAFTTFTSPAGK